MSKLETYFGKKVSLVSDDGRTYIGKVGDFIEGKYNDPSFEDCIIMDDLVRDDGTREKYPVQFNESEIIKIDTIE